MFAERFDALMNIAEVSNSQLSRAVSINSSHIGRLRSGARPLPKKHDFIFPMCLYLAGHITKEYQLNALQKLTNIGNTAFSSKESTAQYLAQWLSEQERDTTAATGRFISGFSYLSASPAKLSPNVYAEEAPQKYAAYLYGNVGKRKAVEQFFLMILQEKEPQTLLLFSDENMAWLYEDTAFAQRWATLFTKVILQGNRVRIIHTVSRNMNELLEAVTKWIPIYITGAIEPYYYPRLRDGVFQRTMFIAPRTAAIISSSVQQDTDGMLNLFLTDKAALEALTAEYERYFSLCRPLMRVYTARDAAGFQAAMDGLSAAKGSACLLCAMPPLFALPEQAAKELSEQYGSDLLLSLRKRSLATFRKNIKKQRLSLTLLDPEIMLLTPDAITLPLSELFGVTALRLTREQYLSCHMRLRRLEAQYENLTVSTVSDINSNMLLYAKEDAGAVITKTDAPFSAFVISERNMIIALWDYMNP